MILYGIPNCNTLKKAQDWLKANQIDFGWQPRFYDRVIGNADELNRIRQYIENNPTKWQEDRNNVEGLYM